jgi:hypothetical protein
VAELAADAAAALGLPPRMVTEVRRAGLVHDLGRVGVPAGIWMRRGPLGTADWEAVRLHPYYTERILTRCGPLAGSRGSPARTTSGSTGPGTPGLPDLDRPALLLAAADAYHALTQIARTAPRLDRRRRRREPRPTTNGRIGRPRSRPCGLAPPADRPVRRATPSARSMQLRAGAHEQRVAATLNCPPRPWGTTSRTCTPRSASTRARRHGFRDGAAVALNMPATVAARPGCARPAAGRGRWRTGSDRTRPRTRRRSAAGLRR